MDHHQTMSMHHQQPSTVLSHRTFSHMLIKSWTTADLAGIAAALVFSFTLTLVLEGIKFYVHISTKQRPISSLPHSSGIRRLCQRIQGSCWHGSQVLLSNVIMLSVMTYNIWILCCVCLGAGVGYFLVRPMIYDVYYHRLEKRHETTNNNSLWSPTCPHQEGECPHVNGYINTKKQKFSKFTRSPNDVTGIKQVDELESFV